MESVDIVKFIATAIQLVGYKLTGLNIVPWNIFVFFIGIMWIIVGYMWKDKVIIVVHVGAFVAIFARYLSS